MLEPRRATPKSHKSPLYLLLKSAASFEIPGVEIRLGNCRTHGITDHLTPAAGSDLASICGEEKVCRRCVERSRALADSGRQGGAVGGKQQSPAQREAWERNRTKRWGAKEQLAEPQVGSESEPESAPRAEVIDLMAELKASLAAAGKG